MVVVEASLATPEPSSSAKGRHDAPRVRRAFCYVRHGETEANLRGVFAGRSETALTPRGEEQARQAAASLVSAGMEWSEIWSSPLRRAVRTAELIAEQLGLRVHIIDELIERDFGALEGTPYTTIDALSGEGLESERAVELRASLALRRVLSAAPVGVPVIVSHGAYFRAVATLLGIEGLSGMPIPNGQPALLAPDQRCWRMSLLSGALGG